MFAPILVLSACPFGICRLTHDEEYVAQGEVIGCIDSHKKYVADGHDACGHLGFGGVGNDSTSYVQRKIFRYYG